MIIVITLINFQVRLLFCSSTRLYLYNLQFKNLFIWYYCVFVCVDPALDKTQWTKELQHQQMTWHHESSKSAQTSHFKHLGFCASPLLHNLGPLFFKWKAKFVFNCNDDFGQQQSMNNNDKCHICCHLLQISCCLIEQMYHSETKRHS